MGKVNGNIWFVVWHVNDHAEGQVFLDINAGKKKFQEINNDGRFACKLFNIDLDELQVFGSPGKQGWIEVREWAENEKKQQSGF